MPTLSSERSRSWGGKVLWAGLALLTFGLWAAMTPLVACPDCEGKSPETAEKDKAFWAPERHWACPVCRDRGRVGFLKTRFGSRLPPKLAAIQRVCILRSREPDYGESVAALLRDNEVPPDEVMKFPPTGLGFPSALYGFARAEDVFLMVLAGNEGMFGPRHPVPFPARALLFDLQGRVLDRLELADPDGRATVTREMPPREKDPADLLTLKAVAPPGGSTPAALVLRRPGETPVTLPASSIRLRIETGGTRLALVPAH